MCDVFGLCISSLLKTFIQTEKGVSGVKRKKDGYTEKNLILTVMLCMVEDLFHNLFFFFFHKFYKCQNSVHLNQTFAFVFCFLLTHLSLQNLRMHVCLTLYLKYLFTEQVFYPELQHYLKLLRFNGNEKNSTFICNCRTISFGWREKYNFKSESDL